MATIHRHAQERGLKVVITEGGNHTKVTLGSRRTVIPRHSEINELTAKAIMRQLGIGR